MKTHWTIVGCGYVGTRLARRLSQRGDVVTATRRTQEACKESHGALPGVALRAFELGQSFAQVDLVLDRKGEVPQQVVVITSPPGPSSPQAEGELAESLPESVRVLYISTTGVYAPGQGAEVSDDHPVVPASARGQARLDVETQIFAVHANSVALRVPGIYGPHRGVHKRLQEGNYRLVGAADTLVARIHVDDLVSALVLLSEAEDLAHAEFIIADSSPTTAREHAEGVATRLKLPPPPSVAAESVSPAIRAMLGADRRIVARRLHKLGWSPRYTSWREGLEQALAEEAEGKASVQENGLLSE